MKMDEILIGFIGDCLEADQWVDHNLMIADAEAAEGGFCLWLSLDFFNNFMRDIYCKKNISLSKYWCYKYISCSFLMKCCWYFCHSSLENRKVVRDRFQKKEGTEDGWSVLSVVADVSLSWEESCELVLHFWTLSVKTLLIWEIFAHSFGDCKWEEF